MEAKSKIGLVTDDVCALPEKIINDYQIELVKTKIYQIVHHQVMNTLEVRIWYRYQLYS